MKILAVHFNDDNFGDVLICNCFEQILKVVLENLGIQKHDYEINAMGLKNPQMDMVEEAELICFAGGGLFGLSYLDFFEPMKDILETAQEKDIPVIFSSIGVNNMDATKDNERCLFDLLKLSCIKAISVRENPELFRNYAGESIYDIRQVCDPAVWTKYVYSKDIDRILKHKNNSDKKVVGINVVRGGLFVDNGKKWYLTNEVNYLNDLKEIIEQSGYECRFYTNGSTFDNNTMLFLKDKFNIPEEKLIFIDSTKELVEAIASFDAVAAIRMHSSIICYAMDIPAVNLVWNDKIPLFYEAINRSKYAINIEDWNAENVFDSLMELKESKAYYADENYLMSLYSFLYETLANLWNKENVSQQYSFTEVTDKLKSMKLPTENEIHDMKIKIWRGQKRYFGQFMKLRRNDEEFKKLKSEIKDKSKRIAEQEKQISTIKQSLKESNQKVDNLQKRIDTIESKFVVRVYRKIQRILKKIIGN